MGPGTFRGLALVASLGLTVVGSTIIAQERPDRPASQGTAPAAATGQRVVSAPSVLRSARHDSSPALRDIPPRRPGPERAPHGPLRFRQPKKMPRQPDAVLQTSAPVSTSPNTIINFEGVNNVDGVLPPDTNGDIGPNHYVQWVNKTLAIYSRSGALLYGPAAGNTVFSGFGGPCESQNDGDPIVLYDHLADRWLLSQFALPNNLFGIILMAPFYQCVAVSQTPDPTGAYYRYQYEFSVLNDYPKFGVWGDGYYMSVNQYAPISLAYAGQGVAAFDRAAMLAGQPASMVYFDLSGADPNLGGMLPSDLDGQPPPPGSPNYFAQIDDDGASPYPQDQLQLWRFHANWTSPSSSTFTGPFLLPVAAFDSNMCDYARNCIPQPGTDVKLDAMADRLMYRLQYRNFGTHESLAVNHTVDVDGTDHAGIRWYEIRNPGGTPVLHQQGTFAPDQFHRWMASAALDASGNLALAYNVSGPTLAPSIRYAGRLATDPPGVLGQGENDLIIGTGSQTHTASRWGDYSMLGVDPLDGCTFWATAEYMAATSLAGWQTRIGGFRFPGCGIFGAPPEAPTNLTASAASSTRINLTWTDGSSDESGFTVERCAGTALVCAASGAFVPVQQTGPNAASYADTSLQPGTAFSYRVRAFNAGGNSGYSNVAEATTGPPSSVSVIATAASATEGGADGVFTITRSVAEDSDLTVNYALSGTSVKGTDYQTPASSVTIAPGAVSATVAIVPIDDSVIEANETVVLTLSASGAYIVGEPPSATVTVVSNDLAIDFIVTATTVPATAGAGGTIQVTDVTKNQAADPSGPSTTSFYLSDNSSLGATDTFLGTRPVPGLAAGASSSGSASLTLPSPVAAGSYYVITKADGPGEIAETSETNNTRATFIRVGPDLAVSALTGPANAGAGVPFAVTDTTKNAGGGVAAESFTRFYLSTNYTFDSTDLPLQGRSVPALEPGAVSSATTMLTIPAGTASGQHYVIARSDDAAAVAEHTETNNTKYVSFKLGGDLVLSALVPPARGGAGSTIVVSDTTANTGAAPVEPSTTAFYLSPNYQLDAADIRLPQSRAVPALAPGTSSMGSTTVTLPDVAPGQWYLIGQADDGKAISESVETNNTRYHTIQIGPDLSITAVSGPATAIAGSTITVSDTTKNLGRNTAGASTTLFYLSINGTFDASDILMEGGRAIPALAPDATDAGSTSVVVPASASGRYYIIAVADGLRVVVESSESNNAAPRVITIGQ